MLYKEMLLVNQCFKNRLDSAFEKDAKLNAIGSLLYVSVGITCSLEENLQQLKALLQAEEPAVKG